MIAARCEKCKNIGCSNDNFICNNWSEEKRKEYAEQYKNPAIKTENGARKIQKDT